MPQRLHLHRPELGDRKVQVLKRVSAILRASSQQECQRVKARGRRMPIAEVDMPTSLPPRRQAVQRRSPFDTPIHNASKVHNNEAQILRRDLRFIWVP
jgi:hypothetical protein